MTSRIRIAAGSSRPRSLFAPVEDAIEAFKLGKMLIVVDDEDRENEGDLTMAAELVTPAAVNFMATHGRGLICLAMTPERLDQLDVPLQVQQNSSRTGTAMCVGIEAKASTSTGISAPDRAATIRAAVHPATRPDDLARPGHVFPLRARSGGVLVRTGHTEAAVDLGEGRRTGAGRRHLRDHAPRRHHGAGARPRQVRPQARAADDHHRRPGPVSDAA